MHVVMFGFFRRKTYEIPVHIGMHGIGTMYMNVDARFWDRCTPEARGVFMELISVEAQNEAMLKFGREKT